EPHDGRHDEGLQPRCIRTRTDRRTRDMGKRTEKIVHVTVTQKAQLDELLDDPRYRELAGFLLELFRSHSLRLSEDQPDPEMVGRRFYELKRQGGLIKQVVAQVAEEFGINRTAVYDLKKKYEEMIQEQGLPDYYR